MNLDKVVDWAIDNEDNEAIAGAYLSVLAVCGKWAEIQETSSGPEDELEKFVDMAFDLRDELAQNISSLIDDQSTNPPTAI